MKFELTPLDAIEPWGDPSNPVLHWFGLSDGSYYIDLDKCRLLEYAARDAWPRYVNYNVARIHEDILEMLPDILETIPQSTTSYFHDGSLGRTIKQLQKVWEDANNADHCLEVAILALGNRQLDTGYLRPSAGIWIWSCGAKTVIEWDNRDRLVDGNPVWTAGQGRHEMAREKFIEEVRHFDQELMGAMEHRIGQVRAEWTRPHVKIDVKQLEAEQIERRTSFDSALRDGPRSTDWKTVEIALSQFSATSSSGDRATANDHPS